MKKALCMLSCLILLSGCGNKTKSDNAGIDTTSEISESTVTEKSTSEASESDVDYTTKYDSYIIYSCDADADKAEMDEIYEIIKIRANNGLETNDFIMDVDYDKHEIAIYFDYSGYSSDCFLDTSALPNLVEFRKGESYSDELILDGSYIAHTYAIDNNLSSKQAIEFVFNDEGKDIFAEVTGEISGTDTPISIWLNKELICTSVIDTQILDGKFIIKKYFTYRTTEAELAKLFESVYLPYSVTVKDHSLNYYIY